MKPFRHYNIFLAHVGNFIFSVQPCVSFEAAAVSLAVVFAQENAKLRRFVVSMKAPHEIFGSSICHCDRVC